MSAAPQMCQTWERTYVKSRGVAGWETPIVCAKLVLANPICLACAVGNPDAPFTGVLKLQVAPFPTELHLVINTRA